MDNMIDNRNYGCTEWWCGTVPIVATNNNRNILLSSTNSTSVPPKFNSYKYALLRKFTKIINFKADTGATGKYIQDKDAVILYNLQSKNTVPWVFLHNNYVIQPKHSGHLPI